MRRLYTTLSAGALFLGVTACAEQESDLGFGGSPPAPPPGPIEPKPEEERTPVPESQTPPESGQVWTQDGGTVVVTKGEEGGCSEVHAETGEQNTHQVTIILVEETPEPPPICTMDIRHPPVATTLDVPLEERDVVIEHREVAVPADA